MSECFCLGDQDETGRWNPVCNAQMLSLPSIIVALLILCFEHRYVLSCVKWLGDLLPLPGMSLNM